MPYVPPVGNSVQLNFTKTGTAPGGDVNLEFSIVSADIRQAGGFASQNIGLSSIRSKADFFKTKGFASSKHGVPRIRPDSPRIAPVGIAATFALGSVQASWTKYIAPLGITQNYKMPAVIRARLAGGYNAPPASNIVLSWNEDEYSPAPGSNVVLEFGALGYGKILGATLFDTSEFGVTDIGGPVGFRPIGIESRIAIGVPNIEGSVRRIRINGGINTPFNQVTTPKLSNSASAIKPSGFDANVFGYQKVELFKRYVTQSAMSIGLYGKAYVQGGVKYILAKGYDASVFGRAATADQYVNPKGIYSQEISAPILSPRSLLPIGIGAPSLSSPYVSSPVLMPTGAIQSRYGNNTVWFHKRFISPIGLLAHTAGYPKAFDPTQFLQVSSVVAIGVFGDIAIRNKSSVLRVTSINNSVVADWAIVNNNNRYYSPKSIDPPPLGAVSIRNNTPELLPPSITIGDIGKPVIGYRIRKISIVGFDRLLFGRPTTTKTPELKLIGYVASTLGQPGITNYTRHIQHSGLDQSKLSNPTTWFRYRYLSPAGKDNLLVGSAVLTHGLREVVASGFNRQAYGAAWISRSTRIIDAKSIYSEKYSYHLVGGTQTILPVGYIATKFGTRIIPEIQNLYPQSFGGVLGQNNIYLKTQIVRPKGYISVGTQPQDKWGLVKAYNLTQRITQTFMGDSGLVPPEWPRWTLIANRNKTIATIGNNSQRFGYSLVNNKAILLSPVGITPPSAVLGQSSMVSDSVRSINPDGMPAPIISSWSIIYKNAREIKPLGLNASLMGVAKAVNTRRYYDRVGSIYSQEFGTPMIADRVRFIDVEKRYSIGPPIIKLPTIDLLTKYINTPGYAVGKYGTPSLSIHFRIITPRWTHRDYIGDPALKNVTPELTTKGRDSAEYGLAKIRTEWRLLYAQGISAVAFGSNRISDTKQGLIVRGWLDSLSSQKHVVTKTGTNPYVTQNIWLNDESGSNLGEGYGIEPDLKNQVPKPGLNQNVLYPKSLYDSVVGNHSIRSNSITIFSGIAIDGVSKGARVYVSTQTVDLNGFTEIDSESIVSNPRLSPHTIWAVKEAPAQALLNHPLPNGKIRHYVGEDRNGSTSSRIGRPFVEGSIRTVFPRNNGTWPSSKVTSPKIELFKTILKPESFRSSRLGLPSIPFTLKTVVLREGIKSDIVSIATISRGLYKGPQNIEPKGYDSSKHGDTYSDNFVRTLYAKGSSHLVMGASKNNDKPFMWQGLRVGELVPLIIGGDDMSKVGSATISLRVREVATVGFDAMSSVYELSSFADRMIVFNKKGYESNARTLSAISITPSDKVGVPDIKPAQHYIRPDGDSNQFRKGGYDA